MRWRERKGVLVLGLVLVLIGRVMMQVSRE
jgi:hypothetical protein